MQERGAQCPSGFVCTSRRAGLRSPRDSEGEEDEDPRGLAFPTRRPIPRFDERLMPAMSVRAMPIEATRPALLLAPVTYATRPRDRDELQQLRDKDKAISYGREELETEERRIREGGWRRRRKGLGPLAASLPTGE